MYGTADTRPTPLISKRFFAALPIATKELQQNMLSLGLGRAINGGGRGMAALEGYVAALEVHGLFAVFSRCAS